MRSTICELVSVACWLCAVGCNQPVAVSAPPSGAPLGSTGASQPAAAAPSVSAPAHASPPPVETPPPTASSAATDAGLKRFTAQPCGVTAAFPATPSHRLLGSATESGSTHLWSVQADGVEYILACRCSEVSKVQARELFVGDALTRMYDKGIDASLRGVKGTVESRKDTQVGGLRGVEYVVVPSTVAGKMFVRMLQVDNCSATILTHASNGERDGSITAALESLRVL